MKICSCDISMGNSLDERKRFKWQNGDNMPTEVISDDVDDSDHQNTNYGVTFKWREGHLLTECF